MTFDGKSNQVMDTKMTGLPDPRSALHGHPLAINAISKAIFQKCAVSVVTVAYGVTKTTHLG